MSNLNWSQNKIKKEFPRKKRGFGTKYALITVLKGRCLTRFEVTPLWTLHFVITSCSLLCLWHSGRGINVIERYWSEIHFPSKSELSHTRVPKPDYSHWENVSVSNIVLQIECTTNGQQLSRSLTDHLMKCNVKAEFATVQTNLTFVSLMAEIAEE